MGQRMICEPACACWWWLQVPLLVAGCLLFALGTLGLFRFPDTLSRLHALTKVDNLGLGLLVLGLLPSVHDAAAAVKLLLIWAVALQASAISAHLVAVSVSGLESPTEEPAGDG